MSTAVATLGKAYWEQRWEQGQTGWRNLERLATPFTRNTFDAFKTLHALVDDEAVAAQLEAALAQASTDGAGDANASMLSFLRSVLRGATVFVPLCGDSPVMAFFANDIGCNVIGVDLALAALQRAVSEHFAERSVSEADATLISSNTTFRKICIAANSAQGQGEVTLYAGDAFALMKDEAEIAGRVDFVYDRASFIAIEPALRADYIASMRMLTSRNGTTAAVAFANHDEPCVRARVVTFLEVVERPDGEKQRVNGPPFHIGPEDVLGAYGGREGGAFVTPLLEPESSATPDPDLTWVRYAIVKPVKINAAAAVLLP